MVEGLYRANLIQPNHLAVFGIFLMLASVLVFVSMLVIQAISYYAAVAPGGDRT
jgi:hypothetical protein